MNKTLKKSSGFTLIELLVVIAIIGVLASVVVASISQARKKGRDARRIRDMQEVQKAIELYILDHNEAPNLGFPQCSDPESGETSCFAAETLTPIAGSWDILGSQLSPYIKKMPRDPCGSNCYDEDSGIFFSYYYAAPAMLGPYYDGLGLSATSTSYRLYAENLEAKNDSFGFGQGSF